MTVKYGGGKACPRNDNSDNLIRKSGMCQGVVSTTVDIIM